MVCACVCVYMRSTVGLLSMLMVVMFVVPMTSITSITMTIHDVTTTYTHVYEDTSNNAIL